MRKLKTLDTEETLFCYTHNEKYLMTIVLWASMIVAFIFGYVTGKG